MQVTIVDVAVEVGKPGPKGWSKAVVSYVGPKGPSKQTIMSFKAPTLFKAIQDAVGKTVEVATVQNEKGYWDWTGITEAAATAPQGTRPGAPATKPYVDTRETPAERAQRQVMIVKQSSLSNAVNTLVAGAKAPPDPKAVLELAQTFVDWVMDIDLEPTTDENGFEDVPDL